MTTTAENLRRLMARSGLTMQQVVDASGVCERTIKGMLRGTKPHARTLNQIANGLGVSADEFFQPIGSVQRVADDPIYSKVEDLLASDQRELLTAVVEVLHGFTSKRLSAGEQAGLLAGSTAENGHVSSLAESLDRCEQSDCRD